MILFDDILIQIYYQQKTENELNFLQTCFMDYTTFKRSYETVDDWERHTNDRLTCWTSFKPYMP